MRKARRGIPVSALKDRNGTQKTRNPYFIGAPHKIALYRRIIVLIKRKQQVSCSEKSLRERSGVHGGLVPVVGLEPTRYRYQLHHTGQCGTCTLYKIEKENSRVDFGLRQNHEQSVKNVENQKKTYTNLGGRAMMYSLNYARNARQ